MELGGVMVEPPLVLDLDRGVMRLRSICHAEASIPRWVYDRIEEGGDIVFARLGLKGGVPAVALVAERYVEPYKPESLIVIDANSWRHGVAIAYVNRNRRIGEFYKSRPNLRLVDRLYRKAVKLWRLYGRLRRLGLHKTSEGRKVFRDLRRTMSKIYRVLREHSQRSAGDVVRKAVRLKAKVVIDNALSESWRDLLEEGLSRGKAKIYMVGVRRFIKILETQLRWYGVPYEFKRLPSRVCPNCEIEMEELPGRIMKCPRCGLEEDRDKIPVLWALKLTS